MSDDENEFCPALPPHMVRTTRESASSENAKGDIKTFVDEEDDLDMYCPALPPHLAKKTRPSDNLINEKKVLGPTLPANYKPPLIVDSNEKGLFLESESEEECEDVVGPLPASAKEDPRFNEEEILLRAYNLREGINKDDDKPTRESWMLELPTDKPNIAALGLGSRQFRKKNVEYGDRTVWTDTPEDKDRKAKQLKGENKAEEEDTILSVASKRRDEELTEIVKEYTEAKRSVPLIESHGKKRKQKEDSMSQQRKPFSREDDLAVNKFDEAQKETILKKARQLNDRFYAGKQKFL